VNDRPSFLDLARNSDWIGGHMQRDWLADNLTWVNRPIEYFASVREPVAQLFSLLNFSFYRCSRSNYYVDCSRDEQQLDAEVMSIDFTNPAAVMGLLFRHCEYFLNLQSRYVLGTDFGAISDDEVARRLATYTYVASETDLSKLYRAFGFAQLPERVDEIHENVSKPHINAAVFESPQLREFLACHHKDDKRLYAAVRGASWPAERRRPFRPAWLQFEVITSENFDEQSYLDSNPDVAAAVKSGVLKSGRAHFDKYGYKETRMIRRWIFPPAAVSDQKSTGADFSASAALERLRRLREDRARIAAELQLRQREQAEKETASTKAAS
jgi:hypothetical protein